MDSECNAHIQTVGIGLYTCAVRHVYTDWCRVGVNEILYRYFLYGIY